MARASEANATFGTEGGAHLGAWLVDALLLLSKNALLTVVRGLDPRDRCLITAQWFTGFRISKIPSLKFGPVRTAEASAKTDHFR